MDLRINEELFGQLWPFIIDDNVTDIKWNGSTLWLNDLNRGRYMLVDESNNPITLDENWLKIFCAKVATSVNENFNLSKPSLKAETPQLRIQAEHHSISGENEFALAIRKTPSVSRLAQKDLIKDGYVDELTSLLLPCLMRARLSGIITGDVGSGKTELEKYLAGFIPDIDGIITVEDTLEMKLKKLYPKKDIYSMRISEQFSADMAIKDALRLMCKWLILSEARGSEIRSVMQAASTGCVALTSIHAENVWEIPDRIINMADDDIHNNLENDIFTFFDYAIKVKADITEKGIKRRIDQICFFERNGRQNEIIIFMMDGKLKNNRIPNRILMKFSKNSELAFINKYREYIQLSQGGKCKNS